MILGDFFTLFGPCLGPYWAQRSFHWSIFWPQILFFSPPPQSRIPVFFPNFSRARVRIYARYDQNWREAPKILGFFIPKVAKCLKLGRNQVKLGRNLGNLGNKTLRMLIFPHSGEFFRGVRSCFLPHLSKSCFIPPPRGGRIRPEY